MTPVEIVPSADPPEAGLEPDPPAAGSRIRVTGVMPNDPDPIPVGTEGVVLDVRNPESPYAQIEVDWEIAPPRSLFLLPTDPFVVVSRPVEGYAASVEEGEAERG